jgi:hypothetical protein
MVDILGGWFHYSACKGVTVRSIRQSYCLILQRYEALAKLLERERGREGGRTEKMMIIH